MKSFRNIFLPREWNALLSFDGKERISWFDRDRKAVRISPDRVLVAFGAIENGSVGRMFKGSRSQVVIEVLAPLHQGESVPAKNNRQFKSICFRFIF